LNFCLARLKSNVNSYLFLNSIQWKKYNQAIIQYSKIKDNDIDNKMKIILLFFPYLLKSHHHRIIDIEPDKKKISMRFDEENFVLSNNEGIDINTLKYIENEIKLFFKNYKVLEIENNTFHRDIMYSYLEAFLFLLTKNEMINDEEKKEFFLLHHFRPFLTPEKYFIGEINN
jgi:hypothetical protein